MRCTVISDDFDFDDYALPLGLGFVSSGFEEISFVEFAGHVMRACLCFMDPDENDMFRLGSCYVHDTSRELSVAAITRRGENPACWIRGPCTGHRPSTIL